jgi:hypothetical protein
MSVPPPDGIAITPATDAVFVGRRREGNDGRGLGVHGDDAGLVLRAEGLDRAPGGLARDLEFGRSAPARVRPAHAHRAAVVNGERDGHAGEAAHLADVHVHGQGFLNGVLK